jgi:hypothetical protein
LWDDERAAEFAASEKKKKAEGAKREFVETIRDSSEI